MLLTGYTKNISVPFCTLGLTSLHCIADLNEDISEVIPYLNASMGGFGFIRKPPSVCFKRYGKLLTVHAKCITINGIKDPKEAEEILKWLQNEINEAWKNRETIEPKYEDFPKPSVISILRYLPKTNCKECGFPTCVVFAARTREGLKDAYDCPFLAKEKQEELSEFLSAYIFAE